MGLRVTLFKGLTFSVTTIKHAFGAINGTTVHD